MNQKTLDVYYHGQQVGTLALTADSLPDAWGQLLLNKYLEKCGFPKGLTALDKLAFVGKSGMGALEYLPSRNADFSFAGLDYDLIATECANLLSSRPSDHLTLNVTLAHPPK